MNIKQSKKIIYLILFSLFITSSCDNKNLILYEININDKILKVEIADTPETRQKGLMFRDSLPENQGMLFIFEKEQRLSFWMKNTKIPLSIAYISKSGVIKEIHDMEPLSEKSVQSSHSVLYALEMNQGYFDQNEIGVGDIIQFSF